MPDHDIENLDGIQYCIYATYVDLSCNRITDVTELGELHIAEELYLAHNQIEYIDAFFSYE